MTSTSSANATALPRTDRRHFMSALGAAGTIGIGAGFSMTAAAAIHPDAELISLGEQLAPAVAERDRLGKACDDAYKLHWPPPMPETLVWRSSDFPTVCVDRTQLDELGDPAIFGLDGSVPAFVYDTEDVPDTLRKKLTRWKAIKPEDRFNISDRDIARVEEILAAFDAYQIEKAKAEEACGYTAVAAAAKVQEDLCDEILQRIASIPASTPEGICIKVRAIAANGASLSYLEQRLAEQLTTPKCWSEMRDLMALSAVVDAGRLGAAAFTGDRRAA